MGLAGNILHVKALGYAGVGVVMLVAGLFLPMGCMTPAKAVQESDEAGIRLATEFWQRQTGVAGTFNIHRPADALTLRIALLAVARGDQCVVFPAVPSLGEVPLTHNVVTLTLRQTLQVAARNDRQYQTLKETIFSAALDLDYQRYQFETSFSGMLLGLLSGDPGVERLRGESSAGLERKFENGLKLSADLAANVVSLLRDDWRSIGMTGDLTATLPLMRGAGREIVLEPMTQAERNLDYSIRAFEYYRQTYAVAVATSYFNVLEYVQRLKNALDNERRLSDNSRRADMMFAAGRMQRIQVDQARSDLLTAGASVISTRKSYEAKLDAFKLKIGLPPEAKVILDEKELDRLEHQMATLATRTQGAAEQFPEETEACRIALNRRRDLQIIRRELDDAVRAVKVAADALRADVTLSGNASLDRLRQTGENGFHGGEVMNAGVTFSLPWNRRKERNAFRKKLVALEQSKRALEIKEDTVKEEVLSGFRNLLAARASYENQAESIKVAKLRVDSNNLFLQSGRSSMRDILEAASALLTARNSLCASVIGWYLSDLELRRDMGVLEISDEGLWCNQTDGMLE